MTYSSGPSKLQITTRSYFFHRFPKGIEFKPHVSELQRWEVLEQIQITKNYTFLSYQLKVVIGLNDLEFSVVMVRR
jgi:hypothetical protein